MTAAEIFSLNSAIVVLVGIEAMVSLLTSGDGDSMTRLISAFSMIALSMYDYVCARPIAWSELVNGFSPPKRISLQLDMCLKAQRGSFAVPLAPRV